MDCVAEEEQGTNQRVTHSFVRCMCYTYIPLRTRSKDDERMRVLAHGD